MESQLKKCDEGIELTKNILTSLRDAEDKIDAAKIIQIFEALKFELNEIKGLIEIYKK